MFKGSENYNQARGTEIARTLHRVGAAFNATTWLDRTTYYEVLPVDELGLAAAIESDRMRRALIRPEDLESERTVVLNELDGGENDPVDLLMKGSFAHAFIEHPYHHPTIGWRGDVEQVSAEVLRGFYDTFYHPDNATVIVAGDVDTERSLAEIERRFGVIPPAPAPIPQPSVSESRQRGERRFVIERAGEVGSLALTWHIPRGLHRDLPALNVLTQALTDGVTSRLHQRLVETNQCLAVHAFTFELHDPGVLQIFATLAPGVEHSDVEAMIREEVEALRRHGPTSAEMAKAVVQTRTDLAFHHESPAQIMSGLTEAVAMGDWRRFPRELEAVSAVTVEDVRRTTAEYLQNSNMTIGWFVPTGGESQPTSAADPRPRPCSLHRPFVERVTVNDLPGGARLAVLPNEHAPTVTIAGTVGAGLVAAADGRFTVPSVTAAMLDRGTTDHDRISLAQELEEHGLSLTVRATANAPATVSFSAQGLADEFGRLACLLVEVLRRPVFPGNELDLLVKRALAGLAREQEEPYARAYSALTRHLYPAGHPLHKPSIEDREAELRGIVRDELETFHRRAYGPGSLVVGVVGLVEPERVAADFSARLEGWANEAPAASLPEADGVSSPSEEWIHIPDRPNLDVFLGHSGRLRRGDPDQAPAVVANSCLGQSTLTSRLGTAVRDRAGLSYSVYSRFFGTLGLAGPWAAYCGAARRDVDRAIELIRKVVAEYVSHGPDDAELDDERRALAGAYQVGLATNAGVARELVASMTAGEPVGRLDEYPKRLLEASRESVMDAIRRHIRPDELTLTVAGTLADHER
jgi:zinc protease